MFGVNKMYMLIVFKYLFFPVHSKFSAFFAIFFRYAVGSLIPGASKSEPSVSEAQNVCTMA